MTRLTRTPRPNALLELVLIGVGYWIYSLIRNGVPTQVDAAVQRARHLYAFERELGVGFERALNKIVDGINWLIVGANYFYATMHFAVTIGVLVWLYAKHPRHYRPMRTALYITTMLALLGFWLMPLAPPRFLGEYGFVDTIVKYHTWGSLASGDVAEFSNQYAAMPSMHAGWALWCTVAVFVLAERAWVRILALVYPVLTTLVIVATANHFVLDIVGGALTLCAGFGLQYVMFRRRALPEPRGQGQLSHLVSY
ncbi:MAG: phosphatase PAP2 family protein [Sporichthyaceae bacterium]|nr:phosphatase PAP2 family protein [Sporichthyaceae bacterium]